jgi:hypothetical protein
MPLRSRIRLALCLAAVVVGLAPAAASAATIVVGVTNDAAPGGFDDTGCTLRDAVQAANLNAPFSQCPGDTAGADTIVLQAGQTYALTQHAVDETNAGGDLDITGPTTIRSSGPGLAIIDAQGSISPDNDRDRVIDVNSTAGAVTLDRLRITGGIVRGSGIGGGGILNDAPLTLTNSEVVDNTVRTPVVSLGGGIYTRGPLGTLTISGSTIAGNNAEAVGSDQTVGGGIAVYNSSPSLSITNSTVSGNRAVGTATAPGSVGGIFAGDSGNHPVANLANVTVTQNQTSQLGGGATGGIQLFEGTVTGSVIAGNIDGNGLFPDCHGSPSSGGGNVIGVLGGAGGDCTFAGANDTVGTTATPLNANLGTLVANGGPTRTLLPNPNSPAINRGGACPTTDQRGFLRAPVAPCDAGAVEVGAPASLPTEPPAPDNDFSFGKTKKNKQKGTARLTVDVPGAGELGLAGKGLKPASVNAPGAGQVSLAVKAKGKARKALRRKGKKKLTPSVTFTPTGGTANTEQTTVKLVRK